MVKFYQHYTRRIFGREKSTPATNVKDKSTLSEMTAHAAKRKLAP
jgi:hypothetical protein